MEDARQTTTHTTSGPPPESQAINARSALISTVVFTLGNAFPRALNLLLLPVYTTVLTPSEYGELSLLLAIGVACSFVFGLGFDTAVYRGFYRAQVTPGAQQRYVNSLWLVLGAVVPVLAAVVVAFGVATLPDDGLMSRSAFALTVAAYATFSLASPLPLAVFRAQNRLGAFVALSIGGGVVITGITVVLVAVLEQGVNGWLVATLAGNVCVLLIAAALLPFRRPTPFDRSGVRDAFRLGIPLIPNYLAHWGLQLADRAVLAGLTTVSSLGVYSLAGNVAVASLVVVQGLTQAMMPLYGRAGSREGKGLADIISLQVLAVLGFTAVLGVVAPAATAAVSPDGYTGADGVVPWLVLGYGFLGLYYAPMNILTLVVGDSRVVSLFTVGAVALNLGLLYAFVPPWGIEGAGAASACAYAALFVVTGLYARTAYRRTKGQPIRLPVGRLLAGSLAIGAFYFIGTQLGAKSGESTTLAIRTAYVLVALAIGGAVAMRLRRKT